jgi:hypothetical protein
MPHTNRIRLLCCMITRVSARVIIRMVLRLRSFTEKAVFKTRKRTRHSAHGAVDTLSHSLCFAHKYYTFNALQSTNADARPENVARRHGLGQAANRRLRSRRANTGRVASHGSSSSWFGWWEKIKINKNIYCQQYLHTAGPPAVERS